MPICNCRAAVLFALVTFSAVPCARPVEAADDRTKNECVKLVLDGYRENYAPLKTIQATLHTVMGRVVLPKQSGDDEGATPAVPQQGKARLEVGPLDQQQELTSSVVIAGVNQRCEEVGEDFGPLIYLRKGGLELKYSPPHFAMLYRFEGKMVRGLMQFDPREAMLWDRQDTMPALLQMKRVRRAEKCELVDGKPGVRIELKCPSGYVTVLVCPEASAYLATQAFHINDSGPAEWDGVVVRGVGVEYDRQSVGGKTILFPKRIVLKNSSGDRPRQTEGYMQLTGGQDVTITVKDLKLNEELAADAFDCPFIIPGTQVGNAVGPDPNRIPANF